MNISRSNFIYLSQIINLPVINLKDNNKIGRIVDLVATLRETYPKINTLIIRKNIFSKTFYLGWTYVKKIVEDKAVFVDNLPDNFKDNNQLLEHGILLKKTFWDKQIVDISGSKLVRVNDLHLLREDSNLWVTHMDVGFKGILRRLGWLRYFNFICRWLFSYELKDKFISWKFVQPLKTTTSGYEPLQLKVSHSKLSELHPADLADILVDLGPDERITIFKALDNSVAAKALQEMPLKIRIQIAELLDYHQLANILNEMPMDEVVDILAELHKKMLHYLFNILPKDKVAQIKDLLEHSKHIAGSLMNTEFIAVKHNTTAGEVLNRIKTEHKKTESIYYIYVLDDKDSLIGVITLRQLFSATPERLVSEFMRKRVIKVKIDTDIKKASQIFYKYNFDVIPVVDKQNKIKGIITLKDALKHAFPEIEEKIKEIK